MNSIDPVTVRPHGHKKNEEPSMCSPSALPSMSSVISSIHGLPAAAVVPVYSGGPVLLDPDAGQWVIEASPGENDGWFVQVSIKKIAVSRHVLNVRVDGGLEETSLAMDLIRERLKSITPDQVTYG